MEISFYIFWGNFLKCTKPICILYLVKQVENSLKLVTWVALHDVQHSTMSNTIPLKKNTKHTGKERKKRKDAIKRFEIRTLDSWSVRAVFYIIIVCQTKQKRCKNGTIKTSFSIKFVLSQHHRSYSHSQIK